LAARLLRLYPPRWRDRFESEVGAVLEEYPVRLTTIADLAAGAIDAWLDPAAYQLEEGSMANADVKGRRRDSRCSFCGKGQDQVRKLVAGPGVFICNECVELCTEVLASEEGPRPADGRETPPGSSPVRRRGWLRNIFRSTPARGYGHGYSPTSPT
jgi:hypothetical protein